MAKIVQRATKIFFEIPAIFSCKMRKSRALYLNSPTLDFLIWEDEGKEFPKIFLSSFLI